MPATYQPLLALALPVIREVPQDVRTNIITFQVFAHGMLALSRRSAGGPVPSVELIAGHIVALFHALFLSRSSASCLCLQPALELHIIHALLISCVGSIATEMSTYILLGVDFVINLLFTGQIYWYHRQGKVDKCGAALMTLVLNEFLEMTVPITFLLCFLVSFYGGNAFIIGEKKQISNKIPGRKCGQ